MEWLIIRGMNVFSLLLDWSSNIFSKCGEKYVCCGSGLGGSSKGAPTYRPANEGVGKRGEYWIAIGATFVADGQASKTIESSVRALNNTGCVVRHGSIPRRCGSSLVCVVLVGFVVVRGWTRSECRLCSAER